MLQKKNFYINGAWVKPKKENNIEVINPATEKSCAVISLGGKEDINDAVLAAKAAFRLSISCIGQFSKIGFFKKSSSLKTFL